MTTRLLVLLATIPPRRASCERLLQELVKQSRPPDGVILCLDGYGEAPAPACPLPVAATSRTRAPSGPGHRWRVAEQLASAMPGGAVGRYGLLLSDLLSRREREGDLQQQVEDRFTDELDRHWRVMTAEERTSIDKPVITGEEDLLISIDDDAVLGEVPDFLRALVAAVEEHGGAAAALGFTPDGRRAAPGSASRGRLVLGCGCGLAVRAGHLEGLQELAREVLAAGGPDALGPCGDDQALVSAHLWRRGVPIVHAATGPLSFAPGTQQESQTRARQARGEVTLFEQAQVIAWLTGWPFPAPVVEMQRQQARTWHAEVRRLPPGAVWAVGEGPRPGFARVCLISDEPEEGGLYDVPAIELLPPRERCLAQRSLARMAARRESGQPGRDQFPRRVRAGWWLRFGDAPTPLEPRRFRR